MAIWMLLSHALKSYRKLTPFEIKIILFTYIKNTDIHKHKINPKKLGYHLHKKLARNSRNVYFIGKVKEVSNSTYANHLISIPHSGFYHISIFWRNLGGGRWGMGAGVNKFSDKITSLVCGSDNQAVGNTILGLISWCLDRCLIFQFNYVSGGEGADQFSDKMTSGVCDSGNSSTVNANPQSIWASHSANFLLYYFYQSF